MSHQTVNIAAHVQDTLRWLQEDRRMNSLLELTYGQAAAGQEALALVVPLMLGTEPAPWPLLHGMELIVPRLAKSTLVSLELQSPWTADAISMGLDAVSKANGVSRDVLNRMLETMVLRRTTPLAIPAVLAALGQAESIARLEASLSMFIQLQLVT